MCIQTHTTHTPRNLFTRTHTLSLYSLEVQEKMGRLGEVKGGEKEEMERLGEVKGGGGGRHGEREEKRENI